MDYLVLCLFVYNLLFCVICLEVPRGVSVSKLPFYQLDKAFTCLDGSATIPSIKINDDYCDCRDGSDEPGTAACPNGRFVCKDLQYKTPPIYSAYVNDGVCDCCDGSDEYNNLVACNSTCDVLAESLREARSIRRAQIEQGHSKLKDYLKELKVRLEQERLQKEKEILEHTIEEENKNKINEDHAVHHNVDELSDDSENATFHESLHHDYKNEDDEDVFDDVKPHDQVPSPDDAKSSEHEDEPENEEYKPLEQPSHIKPIDFGPESAFRMLVELEGDCLELDDREYTYRFCPFKHIYQRSKGTPGDGGTLIGSWGKWLESDDAESNYQVMLYTGGIGCWNGPARSAKVHVHCGDENKLLSVSEPLRCEYSLQLMTPAACYNDPNEIIKRLHTEL